MRRQFRVKRSKLAPVWLCTVIVFLAVVLFELYSIIVPFHSKNPLWEEVTVGQPVIDDWDFGGQNEVGYTKFYNHAGSIVLPPGAQTFDADGKFVVIEQVTPSTLTFAEPYQAIPARWIFETLGVLLVVLIILAWRLKKMRKHRLKFVRHRATGREASANWAKQHVNRKKGFQTKRRYFW